MALAGRWLPDVVVRETCEFASVLAAESIGVPDVHAACFLTVVNERWYDLARPMTKLRAEFGLAAPRRDRSREPYLTLAPRSLEHPDFPEFPGTRRFRAPATPARPLPDWWDGSDEPLVYVSFGSVRRRQRLLPGDLPRRARRARGRCPCACCSPSAPRSTRPTSAPCRPTSTSSAWVPQGAVMAHAAAMVGHGGSGSTLAAMAAGMPLALVPLFADQPDNADRIAALGAGLRLDGTTRLADAVTALLEDPSYRAAARARRRRHRRPPTDRRRRLPARRHRRTGPPARRLV